MVLYYAGSAGLNKLAGRLPLGSFHCRLHRPAGLFFLRFVLNHRTPVILPAMDMLVVNQRLKISGEEFRFRYDRNSGPGGQNVNKVNTKATLRWRVATSCSLPEAVRERFVKRYGHRITKTGDVVITSQRYRDQGRNVEDCLEKLRKLLAAVAVVPKKRKPTRRSRASIERRLDDKRKQSKTKQRRRKPSGEE